MDFENICPNSDLFAEHVRNALRSNIEDDLKKYKDQIKEISPTIGQEHEERRRQLSIYSNLGIGVPSSLSPHPPSQGLQSSSSSGRKVIRSPRTTMASLSPSNKVRYNRYSGSNTPAVANNLTPPDSSRSCRSVSTVDSSVACGFDTWADVDSVDGGGSSVENSPMQTTTTATTTTVVSLNTLMEDINAEAADGPCNDSENEDESHLENNDDDDDNSSNVDDDNDDEYSEINATDDSCDMDYDIDAVNHHIRYDDDDNCTIEHEVNKSCEAEEFYSPKLLLVGSTIPQIEEEILAKVYAANTEPKVVPPPTVVHRSPSTVIIVPSCDSSKYTPIPSPIAAVSTLTIMTNTPDIVVSPEPRDVDKSPFDDQELTPMSSLIKDTKKDLPSIATVKATVRTVSLPTIVISIALAIATVLWPYLDSTRVIIHSNKPILTAVDLTMQPFRRSVTVAAVHKQHQFTPSEPLIVQLIGDPIIELNENVVSKTKLPLMLAFTLHPYKIPVPIPAAFDSIRLDGGQHNELMNQIENITAEDANMDLNVDLFLQKIDKLDKFIDNNESESASTDVDVDKVVRTVETDMIHHIDDSAPAPVWSSDNLPGGLCSLNSQYSQNHITQSISMTMMEPEIASTTTTTTTTSTSIIQTAKGPSKSVPLIIPRMTPQQKLEAYQRRLTDAVSVARNVIVPSSSSDPYSSEISSSALVLNTEYVITSDLATSIMVDDILNVLAQIKSTAKEITLEYQNDIKKLSNEKFIKQQQIRIIDEKQRSMNVFKAAHDITDMPSSIDDSMAMVPYDGPVMAYRYYLPGVASFFSISVFLSWVPTLSLWIIENGHHVIIMPM